MHICGSASNDNLTPLQAVFLDIFINISAGEELRIYLCNCQSCFKSLKIGRIADENFVVILLGQVFSSDCALLFCYVFASIDRN